MTTTTTVKTPAVTYFLLVVGYDAADEVRTGVIERLHEASQLFFVRLPHCAEHSLASRRSTAERCRRVTGGDSRPHPNDLR